MIRLLSLVAGLGVLVFTGVLHGLKTDRWGHSEELRIAAARLNDVAWQIGDWNGQELEISPRQLKQAEVVGHLSRRYHNSRGQELTVLIVCGRPRAIAVHPPDVCYRGIGYELKEKKDLTVATGGPNDPNGFWVGEFSKDTSTVPDNLRIFWAWNASGKWVHSDGPRWEFGSKPFLYKMYVVRRNSQRNEPIEKDPAVDFLNDLLPELEKTLFAPKESGEAN